MYEITQKLSERPGKVTFMVSFNGQPAHLHEVESNDPVEIDRQLTLTAEDAAARAKPVEEVLEVKAGKIAYKAGKEEKIGK